MYLTPNFLPQPQYDGEQWNLICSVHSIENIAQKNQQLDVSEGICLLEIWLN